MSKHRRDHSPEQGSVLVLVLLLLLIMTSLGMSLMLATDVDLKASRWHSDWTESIADGDAAIGEVLWRANMNPLPSAPPAGSRVTVNQLTAYDARLTFDPMKLLSNNKDDDADGRIDEADELRFGRDWRTDIVLTTNDPSPVVEFNDTNVAATPYGSRLVLPTIQPSASWKYYTTTSETEDAVLTLRYRLYSGLNPAVQTHTVHTGASPTNGSAIVFYDPYLTTNGIEDKNTLEALGGDATPANDSPYNISFNDGTTLHQASGAPVVLVSATSRVVRGGKTLMSRQVEAEIAATVRRPFTNGLCGCGYVEFDGSTSGVVIDSYQSSVGNYTVPRSNAMIGCNGDAKFEKETVLKGSAVTNGKIEFKKSPSSVTGSVTAGGTITDLGKVTIAGAKNASQSPAPMPCPCDAYDVVGMVKAAKLANDNATIKPLTTPPVQNPYWRNSATILTGNNCYDSFQNLVVNGGESIILDAGTYYFDTIAVKGSIQIGRDTSSPADGIVDVPPNGIVKIFVNGGMKIEGEGFQVGAGTRPYQLQIFVQTTPSPKVEFKDAAEFRGVLYAPFTDVEISTTGGVKGAIIANQVFWKTNAPFHYDESLMDDIVIYGATELLAWREVR